jgi:transposase
MKGGLSRHQAAAQFEMGISTAILWVQRFRRTGSVEKDKMRGYRPKKIDMTKRNLIPLWSPRERGVVHGTVGSVRPP